MINERAEFKINNGPDKKIEGKGEGRRDDDEFAFVRRTGSQVVDEFVESD